MNVLFLMADELSWWALGHVDERVKTPNLDKLAARSRRFSAAYTPSPICVPTRAAIATGRDLYEIGYWSSAEPYDGRVPGWGKALQNVGIRTTSIGKLHYRNAQDDTGFDEELLPLHVVDGVGWVQALLRRPVSPNATPESLAQEIGPGVTGYHVYDQKITQAACKWLKNPARREQNWCAFVSWLAPHFPMVAPESFFALYDPMEFESRADRVPEHPILSALEEYFSHDRHFTPHTRGIARAAYFGLCSFLDHQVGEVLDALETSGLAEETLVLFTSDHGEMLGEKGFWTKSTMYDSAARVPLWMTGAGIETGLWDAPVSLIDIAPTICAVMGASCDGFSGVDLRHPDPNRKVLSAYHDGGSPVGITMLRWDRWKLVHYAEGHPPQLFDMVDDPKEVRDLSRSRPDVLQSGLSMLQDRLDPEAVNMRAHADQARRVEALGGRQAVLNLGQFDYTPAP